MKQQHPPALLQSGAPWPKFHADSFNSGVGVSAGANGVPLWSYTSGDQIVSSPAIAQDGTIYVGSLDRNLYALNRDGTLKWKVPTGGPIQSSPAIGSDGTIYVGSTDFKLYAFAPDGTKKWATPTGNKIAYSSPNVGSDGTVYVGSTDGKLYAIKGDGSVKWAFPTLFAITESSPAIGPDGTIYVGNDGSTLWAINPDGTKKWNFPTSGQIHSSPALATVGSDISVYVADTAGNVYSISTTSQGVNWIYATGNSFVGSSPAVAFDGSIYIGDNKGFIYSLTSKGNLNWSLSGTGLPIESSPAIGIDGAIYVGDDGSNLNAYDPRGFNLWVVSSMGPISSSPAIAADGSICVGSQDGRIYGVGTRSVPLQSLTIAPQSVTGGSAATGTVFLTTAAPPGGDIVHITSDNPSAVVPEAVTVPEGLNSATFSIQTSLVASNTTANIAASSGGVSATKPLQIATSAVASLTLSPPTVSGGSSSTLAITVTSPAPSGGLSVALASSDPSASVPSTVTISDGSTTATTTVKTTGVLIQTVATITATISGNQLITRLTVLPAAIQSLTLSPSSVVGGSSTSVVGMVTTTGFGAPSGDIITLTSSNTSAATVPASVTLKSGLNNVSFPVTTLAVGSTQTAVVVASFNGTTQNATLTVNPYMLSSFVLSPTSVSGGTSSLGNLAINGPAGLKGVTVSIATSSGDALPPSSVVIPSGNTSATFSIGTKSVTATETVVITASLGSSKIVANLKLLAPTLGGFSLSPLSLYGGQSATGVLTLQGAAPTGGVIVTLTSGSKSAMVPKSVTIAQGSTSTSFSVVTATVTSVVKATLTAKAGVVVLTQTLTISPPTILSVTLNSGSVVGGSNVGVTGTVTIGGSSGKSGLTVNLASSNAKAASVSGSVKIPAGASSATFVVTHSHVASPQTVTIKGTLDGTSQSATLAVNPFLLTGLSLSPSTVNGGSPASGLLTLNAVPGKSGGAVVVKLASSTKSATVPASASVAVGASSATFKLTTTAVASDTVATVTGTLNSGSQKASLTIKAPVLLSFSLSPTTVKGSASTKVTGTVTISSAAPAGGLAISLSSSNTAAVTVPVTVIVPAGKTSGTFTVTHKKVAASTTSTITAKLGAATKSATLTVTAG